MEKPIPNLQDALAAAIVFPDRSKPAVAAELAKHPGQYLRANEKVDWQEAATGAILSASKTPPPANPTSCGSIVWLWNGSDYIEKSRDCKSNCTCKPLKPEMTVDEMPTGVEITKDC